MRIRTWLLFLIGDRQAILDLAGDRRTVWVGLLFVLSAGLAREYDGEDLLHEPWHVLIPLGASLVASLGLFWILYSWFRPKAGRWPAFFPAYRSFLGLFWMTAPLAWLYAVPYERFLTPADAVRANLWTLAAVSLWRVALMVRVATVLMGYRPQKAVALVLLFAEGLAVAMIFFVPVPPIVIMGGLRGMPEHEQLLAGMAVLMLNLGVCTGPVVLALALALEPGPLAWHARLPARGGPVPPGGSLYLLAGTSLAVWAVVLPSTQPQQQRRWRVEQDLKSGRTAKALAEMSARSPTDFPPHWDPPPRVGRFQPVNPLADVLEAMLEEPPAPWVRSIYLEKLALQLRAGMIFDVDWNRMATILQRLPEGVEIIEQLAREEPGSHSLEKIKEHLPLLEHCP